jgi:hypothetical protein
VGEFKNGKRNGQGNLEYQDGPKYVGGFKDNLRHGYGKLTHVDGSIYRGVFKDDEEHGLGIYTHNKDGKNYFVEFKHGKLIKKEEKN